MKSIILADGIGTRLYPATKSISKQILPIYDKPMIYYPLSVLMLAGIRDILIISTSQDIPLFQDLLGDGKSFGLQISYEIQQEPNGLAEAFLIGEQFIEKDYCALILGDNLFYGHGFTGMLEMAVANQRGATIFCYYVNNPKDFGVVEFNEKGKAIFLEEKPKEPKSNYVISGLYFLDFTVIEKAKRILPSERGELEMIDILKQYLKENTLHVINMGRGGWLG
ncbi:glucose-1-phosphate thymidylyltransferase [Fusobacterium necrophorum]|nr:glucose-1-phosphate thymidylyltransferase [Fusobacterium necrophorum]SQC98635.1 Glucose-1-phosphate thymidylyltransferase [Fusobacterium necrophorum subsp. necrophorum]SQC98649.1 Glucose-1-phosphate thymidylyltransferase [Fusobacterium necrophorum subsp. necrophorum]SQD09912.1 Glucose-1-phosphate thymidylyltransferase [Fusobacterium necrophorum subsp. necrophorum]